MVKNKLTRKKRIKKRYNSKIKTGGANRKTTNRNTKRKHSISVNSNSVNPPKVKRQRTNPKTITNLEELRQKINEVDKKYELFIYGTFDGESNIKYYCTKCNKEIQLGEIRCEDEACGKSFLSLPEWKIYQIGNKEITYNAEGKGLTIFEVINEALLLFENEIKKIKKILLFKYKKQELKNKEQELKDTFESIFTDLNSYLNTPNRDFKDFCELIFKKMSQVSKSEAVISLGILYQYNMVNLAEEEEED
jgi:hypothetical protein